MNPTEKFCEHCGQYRSPKGFKQHAETCAKRPSREWMHQKYNVEKLTVRDVARQNHQPVSEHIMARWLKESGVRTDKNQYNKPDKYKEREKKIPAEISIAPVVKTERGCARCDFDELFICLELEPWQVVGCEAILDFEVETAYKKPDDC